MSLLLELAPIIAAQLLAAKLKISTDTRKINPGDIFIALKGENFDGHDFIDTAVAAGAALVIAERSKLGPLSSVQDLIGAAENLGVNGATKPKFLEVSSSIEAYQLIAKTYRRLINPIVIGITGSSGKTTTKEMLRLILQERFKVHFSQANLNNEIGVPQTIVAMPADTEVLVLEMGMRGLGEIEQLSKCAEPNIAIITNIGTAHIERLGSRENIKRAKLEIISGLKKYLPDLQQSVVAEGGMQGETLVVTGFECPMLVVDTKLAAELAANKILGLASRALEVLSFDDTRNYKLSGLAGSAIHSDANAAALVAQRLGLSEEQIARGLVHYTPSPGRGTFHNDSRGNLIIDDSYNANPDSVRASVEAMIEQFPDRNKILVLGDIKESDPVLVEALFADLNSTVGLKLIDARGCEIDALVKELKSFKDAVILVKGSRAAGLERLVEGIS